LVYKSQQDAQVTYTTKLARIRIYYRHYVPTQTHT